MAEALTKEDLCSICLEKCTHPTTLACEHTFCLHCLQGYTNKCAESGEHTTFPCPICRTEIPFSEDKGQASRKTPRNMSGAELPKCDVCKENGKTSVAVVRCGICSEDLCSDCKKYHRTMKATRTHQLTDIEVTVMDFVEVTQCRKHSNVPYTSFCEVHKRLCCDDCVREEHKTCADVKRLKAMASKKEQLIGMQVLFDDICNYISELGILSNDRKKCCQRLDDRKIGMRQEVEKFKSRVLAKVNYELTSHLPEMEYALQKDIDKMLDDFGWCNSMKRKVESIKDMLSPVGQSNADDDQTMRYCLAQERLERCRKEIVTRQADMNETSFEFHINKLCESFMLLRDTLITCKSETRKSKITLPQYIKAVSERHLDLLHEFQISSNTENKECQITSVFCLPNRNILLFDAGNKAVKLFSEYGELHKWLGLKSSFEFVTQASGGRWIACRRFLDFSGLFYMFSIGEDQISGQDIQFECQDRLAVVILINEYYICSGKTGIDVINMKGRTIQRLKCNERVYEEYKLGFFQECQFIVANPAGTCIYVADVGWNAVSAFTFEKGRLILPRLFWYTHKQLKQPSCITVSCQGLVFVCGRTSNNIHVLSTEGEVLNILPVAAPTSVALLEDEEMKVIISNMDPAKRDMIQIYRLF